jgi:hypothetical protein
MNYGSKANPLWEMVWHWKESKRNCKSVESTFKKFEISNQNLNMWVDQQAKRDARGLDENKVDKT